MALFCKALFGSTYGTLASSRYGGGEMWMPVGADSDRDVADDAFKGQTEVSMNASADCAAAATSSHYCGHWHSSRREAHRGPLAGAAVHRGVHVEADTLQHMIVSGSEGVREPGAPGFQVQPRRWVVVRCFAWLPRSRWLAKDYERKAQFSETLIDVAMIRLLVARLGQHT